MKTIQTVFKANIKGSISILLLLMIGTISCSKDDNAAEVPKEEVKLSSEKLITSFVFLLTNNPIEVNVVATIDEENKTISATMPIGTDITGLIPEIKVSNNAIVNLDTAQDFTESIQYIVTAEDESTAVYTIAITAKSTQSQILQKIIDLNPSNTLVWNPENVTDLGLLPGVVTNSAGEIVELSIDDKNISKLPSEIGQLVKLRFLNLNSNPITLPNEIGALINLEELHIGGNQLTSLPIEIGLLINLKIIELSENQLTSVIDEIKPLINLEQLYIGGNQLTSLPIEIGLLINLKILELGGNQLISLPSEIGLLTNLEFLGLSQNQITSLPIEIGLLVNLEKLFLISNQLTSLPPEIGFLSNLNILNLEKNDLTTIPQAICNLIEFRISPLTLITDDNVTCSTTSQKDALISIYSANPSNTLEWGVNTYPEISFHANGDLKVITMNNKILNRIPSNISTLSSLETFNVNNNNLESLPAALGSINSLGAITAASNRLSTVPSELGQLQNLALLSITNNPITSIPEEVCNQQISNGGILTILTDPGEGCN